MLTNSSLAIDLTDMANTANLRVAVVSDAAPHRNGVGAYYHDLENHLRERVGAIVNLCPTIHQGKWKGGLAVPLPGDATQKFMVPNPVALWRQLKQFAPDVVIVPTPGLYGIAGAVLGARLDSRVIVGFHTWYEKLTELYWSHWQRWLPRGYFDVSNKILFKFADEVVVNSEFMAQTASAVGASTAKLVGTPISYELIHTPLKQASGSVRNILFVGRLAAEKNIESIIAAADKLPDMTFNIAGDGPERDLLLAAAKKYANIHYLGWVCRERLITLIDDNDLLILPSHVESFGTVALEAMARQRLVLVSRHCGIAAWQSLQSGLLHIADGEKPHQALRRIAALDADARLNVAAAARTAALQLNEWNLNQWMQLISASVGVAREP